MESKECPSCSLPILDGGFIGLLGSRGTIEILFLFCCSSRSMRFTEMSNQLTHISTKTLSTRLKQLEENRILLRTSFNEIPPRVEYSITHKGQKLVDSLMPLMDWINQNQNTNTV